MSEYRKQKYVQDVFIVGDDGKYYYLTEEDWKSREVPPDRVHDRVRAAARLGAAVAALPEREDDPKTSPKFDADGQLESGFAGLCYLLNIASLRVHE